MKAAICMLLAFAICGGTGTPDSSAHSIPADTATVQSRGPAPAPADSIVPDSVIHLEPELDEQNGHGYKVIKRSYNSRVQVGMAIFMMLFITLVLTSTQEWNPE